MTIDVTINGKTTTFGQETAYSNQNDQLKKASEFAKEAVIDAIWGRADKLELSIVRTEEKAPTLGIHVADKMQLSDLFGRR